MTFKELGLIPTLLRAVSELDYVTPTPIQQQAIPVVLAGRDLIGCAQTGTGKTAAFAVPILQRMQADGGRRRGKAAPIRALVLTPTRELALQIKESFDAYGRYLPLKNAVIFGGVGQGPQVAALQAGVDILVATPGRLNDLIGQGYIDLSAVAYFVLDEADRMLDMGFIQDVKKVLRHLPDKSRRQTLLFSATMPAEIEALADQILKDPVKVAVTPVSSTVDAIRQRLYKVDKANKRALLLHLLQDETLRSVLVFTRTKHGADRVARDLNRAKIAAMAIHGNKSQSARQNALESFKSGKIRVLVATDIAARGIDIEELSCVINFDLPNLPETYVHRIGRTGRAGHGGLAISFCMFDELPYLKEIEKLIRKTIPEVTDHPYPMQQTAPAEKQPAQQKQPDPQPEKKKTPKKRKRGQRQPQQAAQPTPLAALPRPAAPVQEAPVFVERRRAPRPEGQPIFTLPRQPEPAPTPAPRRKPKGESLLHRRPQRTRRQG
ncbi:MAG TPA: DEAD/DEAH box helicase [Candidatus Pygmaiobacter gallistercoris]|nr:DEAD/DEAH box helicase [Candidatus Pygmaiobacter gallistercoris]